MLLDDFIDEHDPVETESDVDYFLEPSLFFHGDAAGCHRALQRILQRAGVATTSDSSTVQKLRRQSAQNSSATEKEKEKGKGNKSETPHSERERASCSYVIPATSAAAVAVHAVNCQLRDAQPLFAHVLFPKLRHLNLSFNLLRELSPPTLSLSFASLTLLDLSHNRIANIDFVSSLSRLTVLRVHHNQIESLSPVQTLSALEELWVSNNKLDWLQFAFLSSLRRLQRLTKVGNPGNSKAKLDEFLVTLCPSLCIVDQESVDKLKAKQNSAPSAANNDDAISVDNSANGNDNETENAKGVSTDVRVMLTQAKAMLKRDRDKERENMFAANEPVIEEESTRIKSSRTPRSNKRVTKPVEQMN